MRNKILIASLIFASFELLALDIPKSQGYDERIKVASYNPKNVIKVGVMVGKVTLIQLQKGETISKDSSGLGIGDSAAWGFAVRGNSIFIKPTATRPDTNLTVVSDKNRTYSFELTTVKKNPTYILNFEYPENKALANKDKDKNKQPCTSAKTNTFYYKWGDDELSPRKVWDDGKFTCFQFPSGIEVPVIYAKAEHGETLLNTHIKNDITVVQSINSEYRLRLGNRVLGVKTSTAKSSGFDQSGTNTEGYKREIINE